MKWLIVTCDASAHIRPVQEWLFRKYAPKAELHYIDVGKKPISRWGHNVNSRLELIDDYFVIFGLDDYLPTAPIDMDKMRDAAHIMKDYPSLDRFELGYGASNKKPFMKPGQVPFVDQGSWLLYSTGTPYTVSCQFSIWKLSALKDALSLSSTPWDFEVNCHCYAGCFPKGQEAFRWIEESALSGKKWPGKINVNGLPAEDVTELIRLGMLDESKLINRA